MSTSPSIPPGPWVDLKTGRPTAAFYEFCKVLWEQAGKPNSELSSNINSGVRQARAEAAAAQTTADAANQAVSDVASTISSGDLASGTMSLSVSPFSAIGTRSGTGSKTTNTVTVTVTGGTGPFTYAWAYVSGDTFTITAASSATTAFSAVITALGQDKTAVYSCTVTDTGTGDVQSISVGVSVSEIS